ncbi:hypothetical protein BH24CHL7_BH24CHL7_02660 [soil metagenome]
MKTRPISVKVAQAKGRAEKRPLGLRIVWQQADAAGISDPVEQADFVLRRLYRKMPEWWLRDVVAKLAAMHAAGTWRCFQRP